MSDKLVEARRLLEQSDEKSKKLMFTALGHFRSLKAATEKILEYLEEAEDR